MCFRGRHVPGHHRRLLGRLGQDRQVGVDALWPQIADALLRCSSDNDGSTAAGDDLPVDEDILALVDRDVVTVCVGVVASAAGAIGLVVGGVGRGRGATMYQLLAASEGW